MTKGIGKFGITGNTGLGVGGMFHVSAPYDSNGKVFVWEQQHDGGETWYRVESDQADPAHIIRCSMCDKPAVSLDHLWPYYVEMNRCKEHYGAEEVVHDVDCAIAVNARHECSE